LNDDKEQTEVNNDSNINASLNSTSSNDFKQELIEQSSYSSHVNANNSNEANLHAFKPDDIAIEKEQLDQNNQANKVN
jgi:hypothetical protein